MATKVLIIEDEPEIQAILEMSLQQVGGFDTVIANDGIEGIERALRDSPDIILMDVLMPRLDGYATCRRIKEDQRLSKIPVIFLTARTDPHDIERAMRAGATGCVAKPFDPLKLAGQISKIREEGDRGDRRDLPRRPHGTPK
ncbi:MAG: response regulator [Armatimonadota bacterium]|nr:response regulator [Armatimonadota bacterium]